MPGSHSSTVLCLASHFKGEEFLRECKRQNCHVILLLKDTLAGEAWPWESIDENFHMPDLGKRPDITHAVSYLARERQIDLIVPLDDYDVETAAALREHLRIPGMGETTARHFRDKLAMRVQARDEGLLVPDFVHVLNYDRLRAFMGRVPPPWVFKPRSEAGSMGIKKVNSAGELWRWIETLGDQQSFYLLEKYIPGDVYHVDSIVSEREVLFSTVHRYARPPMDVYHGGGIFATATADRAAPETQALQAFNRELLAALRMVRGVAHAEYIHGEDGRLYFLEVAARVGGANIAELIEFSSGLNLWAEWARLELAYTRGEPYHLPPLREGYAGILICLSRQDHPDLSGYQDPEIVWRLDKKDHAGLILASPDPARVGQLIQGYMPRFARDFVAVLPPRDKPE